MPIEGQVQSKGNKKRVWLNGRWNLVDKIQTNTKTGQRRAIINGQHITLPPKQAAAPIDPAQQSYEERNKIPVKPLDMEMSNRLPEHVPTEIIPSAAQAFFYEEDYGRMLRDRNEGSELFRDPDGNLILQHKDGKQERINAEGMSMHDVMSVGGTIGGMMGLGRLLKAAPGVGATVGRLSSTARGQAAGAGAYSAGQDVAGNIASGQEGVDILPDLSRTGTEAVFAGGAQKVIGDWVAPRVSRQMKERQARKMAEKELQNTPAGQLTDAARRAMDDAGYPTTGMSVDEVTRVNNALLEFPNLKGEELGRAIAYKGLGKFDPTTGQVTKDPARLFDENAARTTQGTAETRKTMTERTIDNPQEYMQDTVAQVDARAQGEVPLANVQETLADTRAAEMETFTGTRTPEGERVGGRFKEGREATRGYEMSDEQLQTVRNRMYDVVRNAEDAEVAASLAGYQKEIPPPKKPGAKASTEEWNTYMDDLAAHEKLVATQPGERVGGAALDQTSGLDQNLTPADWLNWAERISSDPNQVGGQVAAKEVRKALSDMAEEEALGGVEGGVFEYLKTHKEYGDMLEQWSPDKLIGKITEKAGRNTTRLAVEPSRAADVLFGGRKGGFLTKAGSVDAVNDLRAALSPEDWRPVREELIYRLIGGGKAKSAAGNRSAQTMQKHFNEAVETHGEEFIERVLADEFGTGAEHLARYRRFLQVSDDATTAPGKTSRIASDTSPSIVRQFAEATGNNKSRLPGMGMMRRAGQMTGGVLDNLDMLHAQRRMLDPNAALRAPLDPMRLGILSQLTQPDEDFF